LTFPFLESEAAFAIASGFLSVAMLFSVVMTAGETAQRYYYWTEKQLEADALADFIAVHLVDSNGNLLTNGVNELHRDSTQIVLGGVVFGESPPPDKSVFVARRIIQNTGNLTVLEVRKW